MDYYFNKSARVGVFIILYEIKEETASNKMSSGSQILFIGNKSCNNSIIKPRIKPKIKAL